MLLSERPLTTLLIVSSYVLCFVVHVQNSVYSKREVCKDVRTKFLDFSVILRNIDYLIKDKTIIIKTYTLFYVLKR